MSIKISVITPSFNQGKYIRDTIESVLNQDHDNFEHIVIDGGSTDETINILKEYSHLKWTSEKDTGPANAINKGFKIASGQIFCWINSDDYYEKNIFGKVVEYFRNSNTLLLIGNLTFINLDNEIIHRDSTFRFTKDYLINYNADVIRQPSSFFSSRLFKDVGSLDEKLKLVFDYDLFIRMLELTTAHFVDINFSYYREHESTLTKNNVAKQACEIFRVSRKHGGKLISGLNYTNLMKFIFPERF